MPLQEYSNSSKSPNITIPIGIGWVVLTSLLTLTSPVVAQQCREGPQCTAAQQQARATLGRLQTGASSQIASEAAKAYCAASMMADLLTLCAREMRSSGQPECANTLESQAATYRATAQQSQQAVADSTVGARAVCNR